MVNALSDLDLDTLEDEEIDAVLDMAGDDQRVSNALLASTDAIDNRGGYVRIYDSITGCPSDVLYYMLRKLLRLRHPLDPERRAFTLKPAVEYKLGNLLCMLHRDHPMRAELDRLGLQDRVCRKATLRTTLDVRLHMQHRHRQEWAVIEAERVRRLEEEEAEFRRYQLEYMRSQMEGSAGGERTGRRSRRRE